MLVFLWVSFVGLFQYTLVSFVGLFWCIQVFFKYLFRHISRIAARGGVLESGEVCVVVSRFLLLVSFDEMYIGLFRNSLW